MLWLLRSHLGGKTRIKATTESIINIDHDSNIKEIFAWGQHFTQIESNIQQQFTEIQTLKQAPKQSCFLTSFSCLPMHDTERTSVAIARKRKADLIQNEHIDISNNLTRLAQLCYEHIYHHPFSEATVNDETVSQSQHYLSFEITAYFARALHCLTHINWETYHHAKLNDAIFALKTAYQVKIMAASLLDAPNNSQHKLCFTADMERSCQHWELLASQLEKTISTHLKMSLPDDYHKGKSWQTLMTDVTDTSIDYDTTSTDRPSDETYSSNESTKLGA